MKACLAALLAALFCATHASAQTVIKPLVRPDPAGLTIPDMSFKPGASDVRRYDSYYYFYKPGVSYEKAFADLDQCRINSLAAQLIPAMPAFVPLGGDLVKDPRQNGPLFQPPMTGILPALLVEVLIADAEADNAVATNRKCMAYKGYGRYGTSRAIYKQIDSGTDTEKLARKALIASMPQQQAGAIEP